MSSRCPSGDELSPQRDDDLAEMVGEYSRKQDLHLLSDDLIEFCRPYKPSLRPEILRRCVLYLCARDRLGSDGDSDGAVEGVVQLAAQNCPAAAHYLSTHDPPAEQHLVEAAVEQFVAEYRSGLVLTGIDRFCQTRPPEIRAQLRQRCLAFLCMKHLLSGTDATHELAGGQHLGDFEIVDEIGRGANGIVYSARQVSLNRPVALKVLSVSLGLRQRVLDRFLREPAAAGRLSHPGVAQVYLAEHSGGLHYFAMELLRGSCLGQCLHHLRRDRSRPLTTRSLEAALKATARFAPESCTEQWMSLLDNRRSYQEIVCNLTAQVAETLSDVHEKGVIHRDIKPSNIIIRPDLSTVLTDFGLAHMAGSASMTQAGELLGTPMYISPEIVRGDPGQVDHRTDIYSLGVTLYEMLTLQVPFDRLSLHDVLDLIVDGDPEPPRLHCSEISEELSRICLKAIARDPERRYASAEAFAEELRDEERRLADTKPVQSPPLAW